ncbi:unnamed protein product [Heligmosomoides polygyrus]|uniref:Uncharacterized protein n=1 Tax=Heligmosomoides polygyrus TaxID=6339 RepID=A0A183G197_HELPZ|nr:unnamed protein product [Heligmosomoides polygyrus]
MSRREPLNFTSNLAKRFSPRIYNATGRCFGCGSDMRCFVEGLHRFLFDFYNNRMERTHMNNVLADHFAPQTRSLTMGGAVGRTYENGYNGRKPHDRYAQDTKPFGAQLNFMRSTFRTFAFPLSG